MKESSRAQEKRGWGKTVLVFIFVSYHPTLFSLAIKLIFPISGLPMMVTDKQSVIPVVILTHQLFLTLFSPLSC